MSSTHRHQLLDFFWQVISGPPCIMVSTIHPRYWKNMCTIAKCEEENGQIIIKQTEYCYENLCCVQYHRQENKT
jgi:hypothetical protein